MMRSLPSGMGGAFKRIQVPASAALGFVLFCLSACSHGENKGSVPLFSPSQASREQGGSHASAVSSLRSESVWGRGGWTGGVEDSGRPRVRPVSGTRGMVVSDDSEASEWGAEVLRRGGNAVDAAVATAFYLAVSRPHYASLGGGGFIVFCPAPKSQKDQATVSQPCTTVDYREKAPAQVGRDFYLRDGKARTDLSQDGATASGVPGVVAGLSLAHQRYGSGKITWKTLLSRPIEKADKGIRWSSFSEVSAQSRWSAFNAESKKLWGVKNAPAPVGSWIRQPELAKVLREVSSRGRAGFYEGWVAQKIATGVQAGGGVMTAKDLASYQAQERKPVITRYRDAEIVTMPPPSAGGALVAEFFSWIEQAEREGTLRPENGIQDPSNLHVAAHAMRLGFSDRAQYFGDPDFVKVPLGRLLDPEHLSRRWTTSFDPKSALQSIDPSAQVTAAESSPLRELQNTTHFSVIDADGNAVALTTTVNDLFGSGFTPPGTGIVLNNEMDDFSLQPGVPNLFGLVGSEANAVAPEKRPLSSMTPTIVRDLNGESRIVIGAQGGPRITSSVFQALLGRLVYGLSITDAIAQPRVHHQWKPNRLDVESGGFPRTTLRALTDLGYPIHEKSTILGRMHGLERFPEKGRVWGAADRRAEGEAIAE